MSADQTNTAEAVERRIAAILDYPSVFMGGPSRQSLRTAAVVYKEIVEPLRSRIMELEKALGPFAEIGRAMIQSLPDDDRIFTIKPAGNSPDVVLYRGSLRAAARVLTEGRK